MLLDTMSRGNLDTRERILKAALDLLEQSVGKGVRMSDIAKQAGISRQALYLHFATRAELLIAVTHYVDELKESDARLAPSRAAQSGVERLDAFVEAWTGYIPEIYPTAKVLMAMGDTDKEAAAAWDLRMRDMKEGCAAAIDALVADNDLSAAYSRQDATDLLWAMLSVRNWEHLKLQCGWSQKKYANAIKSLARQLFVAGQ